MALLSPNTILRHVREYLPRLTDLFSEQPDVTAEILAGDPQTLRITQTAHGRSAGQTILVVSAVIPNAITSVTEFTEPDGSHGLRFTTDGSHDLTASDLDPSTATLSGFTNPALNASFTVYGVPSATVFEILTEEALPVLNGGESLNETWSFGPQGYREIDSVVDADTYDVLLTGLPELSVGPVVGCKVVTSWRVSVAEDIDQAGDMYTKKSEGKEWLYLVMSGAATSKDRTTNSDATATNTNQNDSRLKIINNFTLIAMFGTSGQLTGERAIQTCWSTLWTALLKVMYTKTFEVFGNRDYQTIPVDHGPTRYNKAYYAHAYEFQAVYEISQEQGFVTEFTQTRAFRDSDANAVEPVIE